MSNTTPTNSYHDGFWRFIEEHLPDYYKRDDVLEDDILLRFLEDDGVSEEDMAWIMDEYGGDKEQVRQRLVWLEASFAREALEAYHQTHCPE